MNKIVLLGGGGHCKSVLDSLIAIKKYDEIIVLDPNIKKGTEISGCKILGGDDILPDLKNKGFKDAFITVGSIKSCDLRMRLYEKAVLLGFNFPTIVDLNATISNNAVIGNGVFVGKNVVVNSDSIIGNNSIINTGAIIEHECCIGDFCHISVGTVLCGNVRVGDRSFIGANSTVNQGINIGNEAIIGSGSIVLNDVGNGYTGHGVIK